MIMTKNYQILNFIIAALFSVTFFSSCEKEPVASFSVEPENVVQYEEIQFTSTSQDAISYLWDFGGGLTSTDANPKVQFLTTGEVVVKLTAINDKGENTVSQTITVSKPDNHYMLGTTKYAITNNMFWYSAMGSTYIRLLTPVAGQTNSDLLKLYPYQGLGTVDQTYTWAESKAAGTYNFGYTADYAGMNYAWTAIGKTGSGSLKVEEVADGIFKFSGTMILSVGAYDFNTGLFTETSTKNLTLYYVGPITPLP